MRAFGQTLALGTLLLVGTLFACEFDEVGDARSVQNTCATDADCGGLTCAPEGMCVASSIAPVEIGLEVVPLGDTFEMSSWKFATSVVSEAGNEDVTLPEVTSIVGLARLGPSSLVPSRIIVRPADVDPAVPPVQVQTQTVPEFLAADAHPADYRVAFARGQKVRIRLEPMKAPSTAPTSLVNLSGNAVLPPIEVEVVLTGAEMRVDFVYPTDIFNTPCGPSRTSNCALTLDFAPTSSSPVSANLDDLSVLVVRGDDIVSSYGRIEDGAVTVRLGVPLDVGGVPSGPLSVLVGPSSDRVDFPTFRVPLPNVAMPAVIELPAMVPVNFVGFVEDTNATRLPGATLRFVARTLMNGYVGEFTYERAEMSADITTSKPGSFQVSLFPGEYDVVVTPSSTLSGVLHMPLIVNPPLVGNDVTGQIFEVPQRTELGGALTTFTGLNGNRVSVSATPHPGVNARASSVATNEFGGFSLPLDPGTYDIVASPFPSSNFANQIVQGSLSLERLDMQLSAPIVRTGTLRAPDGTPIVGALVIAHRVLRDGVPRSIMVAAAETDANGAYRLLFAP